MTLQEHIEEIRDGLNNGAFINEASVRENIVRRVLHELGWPMYNPQVIIPEYSVEERRVDYALCHPPSKPLVFIEVKQVGQIEGAERQLFEYAFHRGVPIAILTDGREWHFFHPTGQGDYRERRVYKLDLIERDSEESTRHLNRYLNYESMCTGEAIRAIEEDYRNVSKQRQIETSLPEAWIKLVQEADDFLLDVVAEKAESLCGYRPTDEQVLDFLKSLERTESHPREVPSLPTQNELPSPAGRNPHTCLSVTMSNGERIDHHKAINTFVEVIEKLGIERVSSVYPALISTTRSDTHDRQVGQYYVKQKTNTKAKKQMLDDIASRLGIQLKVEIVPKVSN